MIQTGTIRDIKQDVLDALQGRTDVSDDQIARYAARAIRELTESQPFPELQATGPLFTLTANGNDFPISNFVNVGDIYSMPESFAIYVDSPNDTVVAQLKYRTPAALETISGPATTGVPAFYTRFAQNFRFGPVPQQDYDVFLRYQAQHPFSPAPKLDDALYFTLSWYDIAAYATAMRICVLKRWTDQRQELHDMLYGDPEFQLSDGKRGRPGLIAARTFQQERDEKYNSRQVTPLVARVNPR